LLRGSGRRLIRAPGLRVGLGRNGNTRLGLEDEFHAALGIFRVGARQIDLLQIDGMLHAIHQNVVQLLIRNPIISDRIHRAAFHEDKNRDRQVRGILRGGRARPVRRDPISIQRLLIFLLLRRI